MDILREIEGNKILCKYFTLIGFKLNILRDNKYTYVLNIYHGYIDQFISVSITYLNYLIHL